MPKVPKRLGEILIEKKLITEAQLNAALQEQNRTHEFLGEVLLKKKSIKEADLLAALSEQFEMPLGSLKKENIDWDFVKTFTGSLILDFKCFPLKQEEFIITFAIVNPLDVWALKKAEEEAQGLKAKFVLVAMKEMEEAIREYRGQVRKGISNSLE